MMKRKDRKEFTPCKIPRMLVGAVSMHRIKIDLSEYNAHKYKVYDAKARVDTKPPKMNPYKYINVRKLRSDAERIKAIDMENKLLLKKINMINRTIGRVDSYNPEAYSCKSKWYAHVLRMRAIQEKNKTIYQKIISATSSYNCQDLKENWLEVMEKLRLTAKLPLIIFQKESADSVLKRQPSISCGLEQLSDRLFCFLEFQVVDGPFLGRVEIELYHDHVPVTVQNFLSLCCGDNIHKLTYKNCPIHRIVPGRFLESGDITKGSGKGGMSIYGKNFLEEGHKLQHSKAGVLSMVRVNQHDNNSRFCITFSKMDTLDKQNVVFGRITKGVANLFKIEGYGRKIGKPLKPLIISNCGLLNCAPKF